MHWNITNETQSIWLVCETFFISFYTWDFQLIETWLYVSLFLVSTTCIVIIWMSFMTHVMTQGLVLDLIKHHLIGLSSISPCWGSINKMGHDCDQEYCLQYDLRWTVSGQRTFSFCLVPSASILAVCQRSLQGGLLFHFSYRYATNLDGTNLLFWWHYIDRTMMYKVNSLYLINIKTWIAH